MLVLTRKPGQMIRISQDIVLIVKSVQAGRVTLGIEAPKTVRIMRAELVGDRRSAPQSA
jgi:carbon storage regulator